MLHVSIQHHPSRAALLPPLIERLGECEVVADPEPDGAPNPLRTYLACLHAFTSESEASYVCVLQDDAWPVRDFHRRAEEVLERHPAALVCFFLPGALGTFRRDSLVAQKNGAPEIQLMRPPWVPAVATAWPRELAERFLEWVPQNTRAQNTADDGVIGRYVRKTRTDVWATVPSLVEHPDVVPSLMRKRARAGLNRSRVAVSFRDD